MQLRKGKIDEFLFQFKLECDKLNASLEVVSSHYLGSHYLMGKITLDRSQIEGYIESSNADPLEVWRIVAYHELGHHRGYISEESCWDWLETQSGLDQATVTALRSQVNWGSSATAKGRNWYRVKNSLNSEPIQEFIRMNQLSSILKKAAEIETPGKCWIFVKRKHQQSLNLEEIIKPLLPSSSGYLLELCHSQVYDCIESEVAGLHLWKAIQALL